MIYPDTFLIYNGTEADSPRHFTREFGLCIRFEAGFREHCAFSRAFCTFTRQLHLGRHDLHQNLNKKLQASSIIHRVCLQSDTALEAVFLFIKVFRCALRTSRQSHGIVAVDG